MWYKSQILEQSTLQNKLVVISAVRESVALLAGAWALSSSGSRRKAQIVPIKHSF
jgi:hypothetical protein